MARFFQLDYRIDVYKWLVIIAQPMSCIYVIVIRVVVMTIYFSADNRKVQIRNDGVRRLAST